jgi:radical SAM protein with 4Fe4S-binding SPASM domain
MCQIPQESTEELSTAQWKKAIEDISSLGVQTVVFSGGEPLLREDIFELISFTRNHHMNACLTSNGYLINKDVAFKLFRSGINVVNISIEGDKKANDYLRGEGSFDKAVFALEELKKHGIESTIAATVSRYNFECLRSVLELAKEKGATTVRFQPFSRIFLKDTSKGDDFFIVEKDKERLQGTIEDIIKLANEYKISTNPVSYLRNIPVYLSKKKIDMQKGCSALWTSCPINSKGEVFPCWVIASQNRLIGNIKQESLADLWFSKRHEQIRESIFREGCFGCMMSCYDEAFGSDANRNNLVKKIKKMNKLKSYNKILNIILQFLKSEIIKFRFRYRFYKSYKGSYRKVLIRIANNIYKKPQIENINPQGEMNLALSELSMAKERIKKELLKYK